MPFKYTQFKGYPDMSAWEADHKGTTEFICVFCGIYVASKACCNQCIVMDRKPNLTSFEYKLAKDYPYHLEQPKNNSIFPNRGRK